MQLPLGGGRHEPGDNNGQGQIVERPRQQRDPRICGRWTVCIYSPRHAALIRAIKPSARRC